MQSARLVVRVIPRAKRDEISGRRGEALVVRVSAPPVEGAANLALVKLLSQRLRVRPADISIVAGATGREKVLRVSGISQEQADKLLEA